MVNLASRSPECRCAALLGRTLTIALWVLAACAGKACAAEIDRVLAAVNGNVITESDLRMARNLNSLLMFGQNGSGGEPSTEDQANRLIDLELIRQELENFPLDAGEQAQIEARVEELKRVYTEIGGLEPLMKRLGLQAEELQSYLRLQASIMRFVNLRFRPFVTVSPEEVQSYYRDQLLPRLREAKSPVPALEKVSAEIEKILTEEKVNAALESWIKEIRGNSRIEWFLQVETPKTPVATEGRTGP